MTNPDIPVRSCHCANTFAVLVQIFIANLLFVGTSPVQGWCSEGFPESTHVASGSSESLQPMCPEHRARQNSWLET